MSMADRRPHRRPRTGSARPLAIGAASHDGPTPASRLLRVALHRLRRRLQVDLLALAVRDRATEAFEIQAVEALVPAPMLEALELPHADSPADWVWKHQQPVVIDDLQRETRWPEVMSAFRQSGIQALCVVPLSGKREHVGAMYLGSASATAYSASEIEFVLENLAPIVPVLVDAQRVASAPARPHTVVEADQLQLLLEVTNALVSKRDLRELLDEVSRSIGRVLPTDYASLMLCDPESHQLRIAALAFSGGTGRIHEDLLFPLEGSPAGAAFRTGKPLLINRLNAATFPAMVTRWLVSEGLRSACWLPLVRGGRVLGVFNVASTRDDALRREHVDLLRRVADQVALAVENTLAFKEISDLRDRLAQEKHYLEAEIRSEFNDEEVVGASPAWRRVMDEVRTVAATGANVLIQGETGTGKELIARTVHNLSRRREHTFVKICCPAVPSGLLESELFGHERGAYTSATTQKIGRFELAHQGSLFLDEIGDIPLELQPKLLRALEDHEFERLGSNRVIRVDARIIAATNRDLRAMVENREFREDLYYRLNVFPIAVPPLRERREDIPLLVRYFVDKFARRMGKRIESVPDAALEALARWDWPGNVRELANLVERSVVLARGGHLEIPLAELRAAPQSAESAAPASSLDEVQRQEIRRVLHECHGVIGGPDGAAARLGMKRTTLHYRMKKLGLDRFE